MDKEVLTAYLAQGLSLIQIGNLTGRDPSTIRYWLDKHGLAPNGRALHSARGGLSFEQLEPLVGSGATGREIAEALDVSETTVRYWLKKLGLKTKNGVGRRPQVRGRKLPVVLGSCRRHGEAEFVLQGSGAYRCKRCRSEAVARRRRRVKDLLVAEAGGQCVLCGYDNCVAALQFHHLDPSTKSFGVASRGITRSIAEARREARKCILVCANCHAEIEAGATAVPLQFSEQIVPD